MGRCFANDRFLGRELASDGLRGGNLLGRDYVTKRIDCALSRLSLFKFTDEISDWTLILLLPQDVEVFSAPEHSLPGKISALNSEPMTMSPQPAPPLIFPACEISPGV